MQYIFFNYLILFLFYDFNLFHCFHLILLGRGHHQKLITDGVVARVPVGAGAIIAALVGTLRGPPHTHTLRVTISLPPHHTHTHTINPKHELGSAPEHRS